MAISGNNTQSARRRSAKTRRLFVGRCACAGGWDRISTHALIRIARRSSFCAGNTDRLEAAVSRADCDRFATQFRRDRHHWIGIIAWRNWRDGRIRDRSVKTVAARWPTPRLSTDSRWVEDQKRYEFAGSMYTLCTCSDLDKSDVLFSSYKIRRSWIKFLKNPHRHTMFLKP